MKIQKLKFKIQIILSLIVLLGLFTGLAWAFGTNVGAMSNADTSLETKRQVFFGVFREGAPANMNYIKQFEKQTGKRPAMIMWYQDWEQNFPWEASLNAVKYGAVPHIVWEPWYWRDHSKVQLKDIIDGKWDNYIRTWAREIKNFRHIVFLRLAHEFNIEGYPWGIVNNEREPQIYSKAFQHVVDIFRQEKTRNVKWVWCFMNFSHPDESWNDWTAAYPGDEYVDWIGIDGYNWGTTQDWSDWQSFAILFRDQMRKAKKLWPDKPIMVAEFSSAEKGGNKASWIRDLPGYLKSSMREIDLIIWFDIKKEADWRIKSSQDSLAAFKEIMADPIFLDSGEALAKFSLAAVKEPAKKKAYILKAPGTVKIDGSLADWNKSRPVSMRDASFFKEGTSWGGLKDISGDIYLMWDEENFYLAAVVEDDLPLVNNKSRYDIWNGDAIEMVIGLNPKADPKRSYFTSKDYQVGFSTGDGAKNPAIIWNWQRRRSPQGGEISVKRKANPRGYVLEAKVPWKFFRKFEPARGMKLGFDIALDDADKTGERERQLIWNGDYYFYKDPSVWGILEFN